MNHWASLLLALSAVFLLPREAAAQGFLRFTCNISGFELRDAGPAAIHGSGTLLLSQSSLHYDLSIPLRENFPQAAHLHGPQVGNDTPIIPLTDFIKVAGGIHYSGVIEVPPEFMPELLAGRWYVNLHSSAYQGGVLTGFVVPVSVPEPAPLAITGFCMGLFALARQEASVRSA